MNNQTLLLAGAALGAYLLFVRKDKVAPAGDTSSELPRAAREPNADSQVATPLFSTDGGGISAPCRCIAAPCGCAGDVPTVNPTYPVAQQEDQTGGVSVSRDQIAQLRLVEPVDLLSGRSQTTLPKDAGTAPGPAFAQPSFT